MRLADMMSGAKLVPTHLQGKPADCLMVIEQAARWRMSPFAVAQATSVIQGKLMFEGKLVAAAVHNSGVLSGRLSYDFDGSGDSRVVTVSGYLRGEKQPRIVAVRLCEARTPNKVWQSQPDQQLCYAGTRIWARRHAPEVMLGVYSPEEDFDQEPRDVTPAATDRSEPRQYPADQFETNFPHWKAKIESGDVTPEKVISMVLTKGSLTAQQEKQIRDCALVDAEYTVAEEANQ
ncbi:MAG: recombinase RecT [Oceanococcaceae bacterium]